MSDSTTIAKLISFGLVFTLGLVAIWRRRRFRAQRLEAKRDARKFWEEHWPGELYPECSACRFPFPASVPRCPACKRSRIRARALRRDVDWEIETRLRTGGIRDLEFAQLKALLRAFGGRK